MSYIISAQKKHCIDDVSLVLFYVHSYNNESYKFRITVEKSKAMEFEHIFNAGMTAKICRMEMPDFSFQIIRQNE